MNKYNLFRKASIIHAIKCNKTTSMDVAIASSEKLKILLNNITHITEDIEFDKLINEVANWSNNPPTVTEAEINKLIKKK